MHASYVAAYIYLSSISNEPIHVVLFNPNFKTMASFEWAKVLQFLRVDVRMSMKVNMTTWMGLKSLECFLWVFHCSFVSKIMTSAILGR